ncbi:PRAME family member 12-like [Erinaceus europaeus]|uniref:PRAME family member 12-like n=1 Tax=Erinaceus europaeus TaxID=9365 RepID=A0ABM3XVN7_ERIEU|nr:PRAME family member 12-like [Erinaceus europaeus]
MSYNKPSSLLELAIQSLLRDENLTISSLRSLPAELFPRLFLEAYAHRCWKTLKALVQSWPFDRLPLGALVQDLFPENETLKAVLDGIDVLLQQKVLPSRCKLRVLDLQFTGQKFWNAWTGVHFPVFSQRRYLEAVGPSRNEKARCCLEVCVDLFLSGECGNKMFVYLLNWIKKRKGVHLCCRTVTIYSLSRKNVQLLNNISLCDVQELEVNCTWTISNLQTFGQLLGRMNNLRRLCLDINILDGIPSKQLENQDHPVTEFTSEFLQLLHLQELYLESASFLQGYLDQLLRNLHNQLEVFSVTNCTLTEEDVNHLFQSPHIYHLKDLCLRGVPLTSVSELLRALLEINAATLQHLDLGLCGLQDSQLEALLPALSNCSQLSSLSLHGNRLSMDTLEKLLCCTSGLQHLSLQLFPAPLETFSRHGVPQSGTFDLLCTQISKILQDLGYSRSIMVYFLPNLSPDSIPWGPNLGITVPPSVVILYRKES